MPTDWQRELPEAQGSVTVPRRKEVVWESPLFELRRGTYRLVASVRWDDCCANGSNSFHYGLDIYIGTEDRCSAHYCVYDAPAHILANVPASISSLARWNGCHPFGPWYYIENTLFMASDRDPNKLRKGERRQLRNGKTGQPCWRLKAVDADGQETSLRIGGIVDADEPPPPPPLRLEYLPVWVEGVGKEPQLDSARRSAIWPDATDEELMADDLEDKLRARLPALLVEFRKVVEGLGLTW